MTTFVPSKFQSIKTKQDLRNAVTTLNPCCGSFIGGIHWLIFHLIIRKQFVWDPYMVCRSQTTRNRMQKIDRKHVNPKRIRKENPFFLKRTGSINVPQNTIGNSCRPEPTITGLVVIHQI